MDTSIPALSLLRLAPALVAGARNAVWREPASEGSGGSPSALGDHLPFAEAARRARNRRPLVVHMPALARRLGAERFAAFDLLELFAFVRPARFALPTPRGIARALDLPVPETLEDEAALLPVAAAKLLAELGDRNAPDADPRRAWRRAGTALVMREGGWPWAEMVLAALGKDDLAEHRPLAGLEIWHLLPEWSEHAPEPPAGNVPVEPIEARHRLAELLQASDTEQRPGQGDYASAATHAFAPRASEDAPNMLLAEAGTGIGKTLGYLAPATVWAEKNDGVVWISTFTRNLQHQIDRELDRLWPDRDTKARKTVIRKGRENYLCLLNLEDAVRGLASRAADRIGTGLMARWASASRDGDMTGGDFPGWLPDLIGAGRSLGLADRRGECVYSACPHYHRCFIERSVRRGRRAEIVIANHALVMVQAALGGGDDRYVPQRYVFDEGHHLFDAADSSFASHLSGRETSDLRLWLVGNESGRRGRARGLKRRLEDIVAGDPRAEDALVAAMAAAHALPGEAWQGRLAEDRPHGPTEIFLALVRKQVYARAADRGNPYSLETDIAPPLDGLPEAAKILDAALAKLDAPLALLIARLNAKLDDEADRLDSATRLRIEAAARGLKRRREHEIVGWRAMLQAFEMPTPAEFVEWFAVERYDGRDIDVGMYRHWIDPTLPFAAAVAQPAQGLMVTSATLTDGSGDPERDWAFAEARTGAAHLALPAMRARMESPFDYPAHTKALVVTDVRKDDLDQVASAYRELILASGGGALGLFTAIGRLRAVQQRIAAKLENEGLALLAQHVDALDNATLVDIFRAEEDASLLGTDAMRDGVDVPGRSLRLIVFDRVPWPRPDILHRARRKHFGGRLYDDSIARLRLKQAFGRLVRRADDKGVFVLLDPMSPSRLFGAFPPGVEVQRMGLAAAVATVREFLRQEGPPAPFET
ncbi:MAG: ATP-dependent DNA helicase [Dongiaceae bacterium]